MISTSGQSYVSTWLTTSSSDILRPSVKAYGVSHHEQRRSQAVSRTKTHGRPLWVDSPWMEWKISLMVNTGLSRNIVQNAGQAHLPVEADVNDLPKRQKFSG